MGHQDPLLPLPDPLLFEREAGRDGGVCCVGRARWAWKINKKDTKFCKGRLVCANFLLFFFSSLVLGSEVGGSILRFGPLRDFDSWWILCDNGDFARSGEGKRGEARARREVVYEGKNEPYSIVTSGEFCGIP